MDFKLISLFVIACLLCLSWSSEGKEIDRDALTCTQYCELIMSDLEKCEDIDDKEERRHCRRMALNDGTNRDCHCRKT